MDVGAAPAGRGARPVEACADPCAVTGPVAGLRAAAAAVGGIRVGSVDAEAALDAVLAARWVQAAALVVEADALARLEAAYPGGGLRGRDGEHAAVVFELMAALGVSQRSAANRLSFGSGLAGLPGLGEEARSGGFDVPMLLLVLDKVAVLDPTDRAEAVDRLLEAHRVLPGGLTRAQAGRLLGRIVAGLDPDGAQRRQAAGRRGRRVWHDPAGAAGEESTLGMTGPAQRVAICFEVVDALARAMVADRHTGPGPTLDQARFDALEWLVTGRPATAHPAWPAADPDHPGHPGHPDPDHDTDPAGSRTADGDGGRTDAEADDDEVPPWELPPRRDIPEHRDPDNTDDTVVDGESAAGGGEQDHRPDPDDATDAADAAAGVAGGGDPGVFAAGPAPGLPGLLALLGLPTARAPALGAGCGCGRPRVSVGVTAQVTVALPTLLGLDDAPGELAGLGPVPACVARELAAAASTWRRLLTDPADGHLLTAPIRTYRPTAAVRAFVLARAGGVCAWRGCTARHDLQLDHDTPWPAGPTGAGNTVPLHQPHHDAKTCGAWCHRLHPASGALTQTSPLGRTYTTTPLPPLGEHPVPDPDPTTLVRARLHRL
ncbi:MAG TPA: HNH endonuclease, partial [Jiangellales bacterium]|nr:HNH endonuclease [Jiangellales bacterium]